VNDFEARLYDNARVIVANLGAIARSVARLKRMDSTDAYHVHVRPEPIRRRIRRDYRPPASKRAS